MKRSKLLLWLLPALWALILTLGLAAYALNQNPAGLARSLVDRLSDPENGFTLSARTASFTLFPLPAVRLTDVTARTPGAALFVNACEIIPDPWSLLHGALVLKTVQIKEAALLIETSHSSAPGPSFALPPEAAGANVTLENGTLILLRAAKGTPPRPVVALSALSGSCTLPEQAEGPAFGGGNLSLTAGSVTHYAEANGANLPAVKDIRLNVKDITYLPSESGKSVFGFKAQASLPVQIGDTPPHAVLSANVRHENGILNVDGVAALDGTLTLPRQVVPVHALVPYTTSFPIAELRKAFSAEIALKGATLKADGDEARFDGRLALSDESSPSPRLRGTLAVKRLSLPRWFGFARDLPPGVQAALSTLSGTLPLELTPRSLSVTSATATALGTTFSGEGGVADFAHPVVALHLATPEADVNRLFPQIVGKKTPVPTYSAPPVFAEDVAGSAPGYDIRLSASRAAFSVWKGKDVSVRISPDPTVKGEPARVAVRCGSFYGGSAQADLLPGDELSLTLSAKAVKTAQFLTPLTAAPPLTGTLTASASLTTRPASLAEFLASLRGSAQVTLENGTLKTAHGSRPLAFSRLRLAFQGAGNGISAASYYGFKGQWQADMTISDWQGSVSLTGPLFFSIKEPFGVRAEAAPASATVSAKGCTAKANGFLSFDTGTVTASADKLAGDVTGNGGTASFSGSFAASRKDGRTLCEAPLSLSSRNPRPLLAQIGLVPADLPARAFRLADLKAVVRLDGEALRLDDMEGIIDDTRFSGQLQQDTNRWTGNLRLGVLNVGDYLPISKAGGRNAPWDMDWMRKTDIEGQINAERLVFFRIPHENVTLPINLKNGVLTADPIRARVAEGTAGAGFRAEAVSGGLLGRLRYTLDNVNVLTLCKERGQQQLLSGRGNLDVDVNGFARSGADLPAALKGTLGFAVRNGELDARHPGAFSRFRSLSASGTLAQGVLTTRDLRLDGALSVRGYGNINLSRWTLDYTLNVTGPGIPNLPVHYYGSLDNPKRSLNTQGFLANAFGSLGNGILTILDGVVSTPLRLLAP